MLGDLSRFGSYGSKQRERVIFSLIISTFYLCKLFFHVIHLFLHLFHQYPLMIAHFGPVVMPSFSLDHSYDHVHPINLDTLEFAPSTVAATLEITSELTFKMVYPLSFKPVSNSSSNKHVMHKTHEREHHLKVLPWWLVLC